MQWLMLQQDRPDDFVIATGQHHSVREFVVLAAKEMGLEVEFSGEGLEETGKVASVSEDSDSEVSVGDIIIRVDPRYFRPTEVEELLGDPSKAKEILGWSPQISIEELCSEMVTHDLNEASKEKLISQHENVKPNSTE